MTLRSSALAADSGTSLDLYDEAVRNALMAALGSQHGWPDQLTDAVVSLVSAAQFAARQAFAVDHKGGTP